VLRVWRRRVAPLVLSTGLLLTTSVGVWTSTPASAFGEPLTIFLQTEFGPSTFALEWAGTGATTYDVIQADDAALTSNVFIYSIHNGYRQFTPYQVTAGQTYYYVIRARAGPKALAYSNEISATPLNARQRIKVMTYNILKASQDGKYENGRRIAPWSKRVFAVAEMIRSANPDVIAIEEGEPWIGPAADHVRQVDTLMAALGPPYQLAETELTDNLPGSHSAGDYIIYNSDRWTAGPDHSFYVIGQSNPTHSGRSRASYQDLTSNESGARVLMVATHLTAGISVADNVLREYQADDLFEVGSGLAQSLYADGTPVDGTVYAGDFNAATASDSHYRVDATLPAAQHDDLDDAFFTATSRVNGSFNSANIYRRTPPKAHNRIDRIFATPGIATVRSGVKANPKTGVIPSDHNPVWADVDIDYSRFSAIPPGG
jgi:endonuclease/exonuclease/phosphatase family metal-dependent hydrolase